METPAENKQASGLTNKKIIAIAAVIIVLLIGLIVFLLMRPSTTSIGDEGVPKIGYESNAKVMLDQNSLQAAYDEALRNAEDGYVGLKYKNDAYSSNGTDFECYIMNSESNAYDMFLTIYTDETLEEQLFLSGLVPPGSGFESITLSRALEPGDHTVCVALTLVDTDEETGEQTIKNQAMHTMTFHVTE